MDSARFLVEAVVDGCVGSEIEQLALDGIALGVEPHHFSWMVEDDVVDLMTGDVQHFLEGERAQNQRIRQKYRRVLIEFDTSDSITLKVQLQLHGHEEVAVVGISLGNEKEFDEIEKLLEIALKHQALLRFIETECPDCLADAIVEGRDVGT